MKNLLPLAIALSLLGSALSCCNWIECTPPDTDEFGVDSVIFEDPQCCAEGYSYKISGNSPAGGGYYRVGLFSAGRLVLQGKPIHVTDGDFCLRELSLVITYLDEIPPGLYFARVLATATPDEIEFLSDVIVAAEAGPIQVPDLAAGDCIDCCTEQYGHAGIQKENHYGADVVGARADILVRYPNKLCGSPAETLTTPRPATVTVVYDTSIGYNGHIWAQTGFLKWRPSGFTDQINARMFEVCECSSPDPSCFYSITDYEHPPSAGQPHEFQVELQPSTGQWTVYINGVPWKTSRSMAIWQQVKGSWTQFEGEVTRRENDMVGAYGDECVFSDCSTKRAGGTYQIVTFRLNARLYSTDWAEWQADTVGESSIKVWDVNPR